MTPGAIERTSLCSSRAGIRFDFRYLGMWTENWRSIVINHFQCFIAPGSGVVGLRHITEELSLPANSKSYEAIRSALLRIVAQTRGKAHAYRQIIFSGEL